MELKSDYNLINMWIIPDDWAIMRLGDITTKVGSGLTPTGGEKVYKKEGRPFLRSQNVGWGFLLLDDIVYIDDETHSSFSITEIKQNDVFLNITGASIGRSAVADSRLLGGNVNQHVCIIRTDTTRLVPKFLNQYLLSETGQKQIDSFQAGGNRQGLNFEQIRSFLLAVPPLPEQRAIAAALSDIDALIASLDNLIAKKRLIMLGAMQQLLTGKIRLPGFSGEWKVKLIREVFDVTAGGDFEPTQSSSIEDERYCFPIYSNSISKNGLHGFCSYADHQTGSITVTARGTLGVAHFRDHPYTAIGRVLILQPNQSIDGRFFSDFINHQIDFVIESTGVPQLTAPQISKCKIPTPSLPEQTAIATVLSDMDAEITALEHRRDKTFLLKQGMMQELLTGKTRLI